MKYPNFREEKKLWKREYKIVVGLDEAGRGCERPDAEVLTNNGWKFYSDITLEDKALSYTDKGFIKWQKIGKVIEKDFEGNLIEFKNRGIDIVVTSDHYFTVIRRVFKRDKKDSNRLRLIGYTTRKETKVVTDLLDNDFIPRGGKWKGTNKIFFRLPKVDKNKEKLIDIKLWVAFLGIFLSEGSVSYYKKKGSYKITISQIKNSSSKKYKKIYYLLKNFPFKFNNLKNGFNCYNKQLYFYLKQFGRCYDKFIPKNIKELSPQLLNILVNWMLLGDGACYIGKNRKKVCIYYTVSERLKNDFEEILLKAGWTYHTSVRVLKDVYIKKRIIKKENRVPCFEVRLRRNNKAQIKSLHKKEIFYKGKIFCLQLPQHHNFYVRRNGTGYFTGNSLAGPVIASAVTVFKNSNFNNQYFRKLLKEVNDSKKLSPKKRDELFEILTKNPAIKWGIGRVSEKIIDRINILEATKLAMLKAVINLEKKRSLQKIDDRRKSSMTEFLILDGNFKINTEILRHIHGGRYRAIAQKSIIKADGKVFSCAAASIIAKVSRDRIMLNYHKKYPQYGFDKHKGYPTETHIKNIEKYGICRIHRKTFNPVSRFAGRY